MKKLNMQTPDGTENNISEIAKLFPNVITEKKDENGETKKAVDFDLLKQILSKDVTDESEERYRLDWPGKKRSLVKANTPITKTLRPIPEDSVNFDETENVYIEGDNFEVLKILQESYLGKVKMIYIDPPYNTGKDFVYTDKFKISKEEYEDGLGIEDEEGGKLFKNTDTNGRFHSDWLSMMYERLIVARDLLKDDGVIFMSIDDNEVHNLRKIADEVFGEENFVGNIGWESKTKSQNTKTSYNKLQPKVEHILLYTKNSCRRFNLLKIGEKKYPDKDEKGSFRRYPLEVMNADGMRGRDTMVYSIKGISPPDGKQWQLGKDKIDFYKKNNDLLIENESIILKMRPENESSDITQPFWGFLSKELGTAESAKKELSTLLGKHGFETVKPVSIIRGLIFHCTSSTDLIFDFFSGSATTAHATMQLNAEDGGNRKFVMVQLPEETDEKSEAFKAGYKTIPEIGKERIRRAGKKILEENAEKLKEREEKGEKPLDIGFRVYKTDSTNMKNVFYKADEITQESLGFMESNIKENRTPQDLLTQTMLDLGLTLDLPIETKKINENTVFFVAHNALVACFDDNINFEIIDSIAECKPLRVVFQDACFQDDKDRINTSTRLKNLSPETVVRVL